jgi:DNA primase
MGFSDSFLQEVRNAAGIVEIIGSFLNLKKRGRNHVGLCPFHQEKTPSFNVSEERQWFHCFGCGATGDVFRFLMLAESLTFPEAVRWVAERYGIPIPASMTQQTDGTETDRETLMAILRNAAEYFSLSLESETEAESARQYLQRRDLKSETIARFGIGYAPGTGDRLCRHLQGKGFSAEMIAQAGLARKSENGPGYYDIFRRRLIIPIRDLNGKTIAFGGRVLDEGSPKYINSPETPVYSKGRCLFGLNSARETIRKTNFVVLVEGYLDCISAQQGGVGNVVASLGTSLTQTQARILARYAQKVIVNYDPDIAGVNAARRSLDLLLEEGFRVNVLVLPEGLDPDAAIRKMGAEFYQQQLRRSVPYLEFLTEEAMKSSGGGEHGSGYQIQVLNSVLPFLSKVNNRVERLEYVSRLAYRLNLEESVVLAEFRQAALKRQSTIDVRRVQRAPELLPAERKLLRSMLIDETLRDSLFPFIRELETMEHLRSASILQSMRELFEAKSRFTFSDLESKLQDPNDIAVLSRIYFHEDSPSIPFKDAIKSIDALKRLQLERELKRIQKKIENYRGAIEEEELLRLSQRKIAISRDLKKL